MNLLCGCTLLLCLNGLLRWDVCEGQRVVDMQEGPLYRAKGYPVTISCSVSGFKGPSEQTFEFSVYKPARPETEIKIISTFESNFAYALYSQRVRAGEIQIQRLTGSSVLLHINKLQEDDGGEYECYTPNTDGTYFGTYNAKTTLKVIQDTLSASANPAVLSKTEGEALQLECEVSSQTFQHTHLSVTWFLQSERDGQPRPIISLTRDFTLSPGGGFEDRYRASSVSLDKVQDTTYRLSVSQLQLSDQGSVYCQASEWIQDPDRSWYRIAYKNSEAFTLQVQPIDVLSGRDSFNARIEAPVEDLGEGDTLEIQCTVEAQNVLDSYFSVAWLKDDKEMAGIGPTGVSSIGPDYARRESEGELKVIKKSDRDYLLAVRPVRTEDAGKYICRVSKEEKAASSFTRGQSQDSSVKHVAVTVTERKLAVTTSSSTLKVNEGDVLQITCSVSGATGQQSVSWQHRHGQGAFSDVISLSRNGVMESGARYRQRAEMGDVRTLRATQESFTLEIANALLSDAGDYKCTVSDWVTETKGSVKKLDSKSQEVNAEVRSVDSLIRADLRSRTVAVRENEEIELFCKVKGPRFPLSVTWKVKRSGSPSQEQIVSLFYDGVITWWKNQHNYQFRTQVQPDEVTFILKVFRASAQEAGTYQCVAEAFLRQTQKALKSSNVLAVQVQKPKSLLSISAGPQTPLRNRVGSDVRMECDILSATMNASRFAMSWLFQPEGGQNHTILRTDRDSILEVEVGQRYSLRRREARSYELLLQQAGTADNGHYYCLVEEWLQDPHGDWAPLESTSTVIQLLISPQESSFSVTKAESKVTVRESEHVLINCSLGSNSILPASHYSVTWFFVPANTSERTVLMRFSHDAVLDYTGVNVELVKRMRFYRPTLGSFSLAVQNMDAQDSGGYSCQVDEYQLNCEGEWLQSATDQSGVTTVSVLQTESNLHVLKDNSIVTMGSQQGSFVIVCNITSHSSAKSVFEVTWWHRQAGGEGESHPIFRAQRNFTLQHLDKGRAHLLFGRPQATLYTLTVPDAEPSDSGQYYCRVEEWLLSPRNTWRKIAEDSSGYLTVSFQAQGITFAVLKPDINITVQEGEAVVLQCKLKPGSASPASHYSITWFFIPVKSSERTMLMRFSHDAVLDYTGVNAELVKRMLFFRPALGSFGLTVQNMDAQDSGGYSCQVDEYRLSSDGEWLQSATDQSGVTTVSVLQTESDLHVLKHDDSVTMSNQQGSFVIACNITSHSSAGSVFEVTWWRRQAGGEGESHPIFRARRDFTLQHLDKGRAHLLFGRPQATLYTLTVPDAEPSDSGQYYCRVEEWLLSPRNTWRKIAEDSSGYLTVSFQAQAGSTFSVLKPEIDITVQEGEAVVLQCKLKPGSALPVSHYSVTWFFIPANSSERTMLMRFSHDAVLDYTGVNAELVKRMRFDRPALGSFSLTIQNMDAQDSGSYSCQVNEYQLSCEGEWLQSATDQSGVTTVSVLKTERNLHVLKHNDNVTVSNQQGSFMIVCNITSHSSSGSVFEVTWWRRQAGGEGEPHPIFRARRNFTLQHLDKGRAHLHFDRPQATLYTLTVPDAEPSDRGQYYCRVEEWLLSPRNTWRKIAEDSSGYLTVSFQEQERNLHVLKHNDNVTVSNQQGSFVIVCNITSHSSAGSVFEVTWWRQQAGGEGEPHPIFRARRNFTLQHLDKGKAHLLFGRPQATLYTLTVPDAKPSDSGQYYCHVEEWLLSPRNTWRKIAEDSSGYLTVSFQEQGGGKEALCASGALPVVLALLIALLVLAIGVLAYKLWKAGHRSAKWKADESLWAESNPLKPKPES